MPILSLFYNLFINTYGILLTRMWRFHILFLCENLTIKELISMLNDLFLEKIFSDNRLKNIPVGYQSIMIDVVSDILEELGVDLDATISES